MQIALLLCGERALELHAGGIRGEPKRLLLRESNRFCTGNPGSMAMLDFVARHPLPMLKFSFGPRLYRNTMPARRTDGSLYHRLRDGSARSWRGLGGVRTFDPDAVAWSSQRLDIFFRGSDQGLPQIW